MGSAVKYLKIALFGVLPALSACTVRVGELFDQTPGPAAGTPMQRAGPH